MKKRILSLKRNECLRSLLPEECGLAAAINLPRASRYVYDCLVLQEHRGEKGVGIVSIKDRNIYHRRHVGRVRDHFVNFDFDSNLPGKIAIGHTRYATEGEPGEIKNVQPLIFLETKYGPIIIAHNGTLVNSRKIKSELIQKGAVFQSTTDSEIFGHLIALSSMDSVEGAIISALEKVPAAYSLLVLTKDKLFAIRDRFGVRPLSIAGFNDGFLICSENYAFDQYREAGLIRDIDPGEMIVFDRNKEYFRSVKYAHDKEHFCIFEGIYFSNPRTTYRNFPHEDFRQELGKRLFAENPNLAGDFILPVLDSGKQAALGLAKASGILYKEYFLRVHNPPGSNERSFTSPTEDERTKTAYQKLHLRKDKIKGRRAIVVDDSIVRSTTMKIVNKRLRDAGASYVINCISAPPIINICPYGMDYQDKKQLVAAGNTVEEIRKIIGADELIYISLPGLKQVVSETYQCGICYGCFGGKYPIKPD